MLCASDEPACRILDKVLVSKGGLTETAVDIRLILREALLHRAPVIALCHNHPLGQVRPSMEDDRLTTGSRRLAG